MTTVIGLPASTRNVPGIFEDLRSDHAGEVGAVMIYRGVLPAIAGSRAVYGTIAAVERFVVAHYDDQIRKLAADGALAHLRATLEECQSDEARHRDEAAACAGQPPGALLRLWTALVGLGSRYAVMAARRL